MLWIVNILLVTLGFLLLAIVPAVGTMFLYAAITGKFIPEPPESEPRINHMLYRIRGIIGAGFLILGLWMLWGFIRQEFFS